MFPVKSQPSLQGKAFSNTWADNLKGAYVTSFRGAPGQVQTWPWKPAATCPQEALPSLPSALAPALPTKSRHTCKCHQSASRKIGFWEMKGHAGSVTLHFPIFHLIPFLLGYSLLFFFVVCNAGGCPSWQITNACWRWFRHHQPSIVSRVSFTSSQKGPPIQSHCEPESGREKHEEPLGEHLPKERCP